MIFSKAGLTRGADPLILRLRPGEKGFQSQLCLHAGAGEEQCRGLREGANPAGVPSYDHAALGQPASASSPCAEVLWEALGPPSPSGQAVSPPKWTVGKLNDFWGT